MKAVYRYLFISADVTIWMRGERHKSRPEKWRHFLFLYRMWNHISGVSRENMQHLTNRRFYKQGRRVEGGRRAVRLAPDILFVKKKKDPCNPSILEAKKILIRRAITRARGKSPLMKFPVDHMQFVSSQWTTNCKGRYQGASVLSAVNWLVEQVQILYPHSHVRNREHINST